MKRFSHYSSATICLGLLTGVGDVFAAEPTAEGLAFFEKKIRPVLVEHCYKCHSASSEKVKGELLLDTREGIRKGGESGHAVVPKNLDESLLIEAIRYGDKDFEMPPKAKLPDSVIADFEKWIMMGAPDPRDGKAAPFFKPDWTKSRNHWAFKVPKQPIIPKVKEADWAHSDIDRFVLAKLEDKSLKPMGEADRRTLIRRLYFDLNGLPPTPQEVDSFVKDKDPKAYEKLVDRLLGSEHFGERWGRHWLDVARYAESSGKESNIIYPHAWRYRDYVIDSFNADKPYNQFIREQIAGDMMRARDDRHRAELMIATGFLAIGPKSHNEGSRSQFAAELADEQIETMSRSMLGLTIACARCHDHKFDPIPQHEYYAIAGIFQSSSTYYGTVQTQGNRRSSRLRTLPMETAGSKAKPLTAESRARLEKTLADGKKERERLATQAREDRKNDSLGRIAWNKKLQEALNAQLKSTRKLQVDGNFGSNTKNALIQFQRIKKLPSHGRVDEATRQALGISNFRESYDSYRYFIRTRRVRDRMNVASAQLNNYDANGTAKPQAMGMRERGYGRDTRLLVLGQARRPRQTVSRGFVKIVNPDYRVSFSRRSSGRLQLADWLVAPDNPLTSRVMVNRIWHHLFGQGLLKNMDNFGSTGGAPSHPELLDHLALRFAKNGWSVKGMVREIVLSRTYQLASDYDSANYNADPDNSYLWRRSTRRLDAESIRDSMLSISGLLKQERPRGSAASNAGDGRVSRQSRTLRTTTNHRSVYLPIVRDMIPEPLRLFDYAEPSMVTGKRDLTIVPAQALYLMNDSFVTRVADAMASRVLAEKASRDERIKYAYQLAYARPPKGDELEKTQQFFNQYIVNTGEISQLNRGMKELIQPVKELQQALNAQLKSTRKLQVDGDFGSNTKNALIQFQRLKNLPDHGRVDEATRKSLGIPSYKENLEKIAWNNAMSAFCQALLCSAEFRYLD